MVTIMRVWAYLRASTKEQDADRALKELEAFAHSHDLKKYQSTLKKMNQVQAYSGLNYFYS